MGEGPILPLLPRDAGSPRQTGARRARAGLERPWLPLPSPAELHPAPTAPAPPARPASATGPLSCLPRPGPPHRPNSV